MTEYVPVYEKYYLWLHDHFCKVGTTLLIWVFWMHKAQTFVDNTEVLPVRKQRAQWQRPDLKIENLALSLVAPTSFLCGPKIIILGTSGICCVKKDKAA